VLGRSNTAAAIAAALILAAAAGCTPGDDDSASTAGRTATTTTTTQPPGTQPDRVERYVNQLLYRYDKAVNRFVAEPAKAGQPDDPTVKAYRGMFSPGAADVDRALAAWAADAAKGERYAPFDEGGAINRSKLDGKVTTVSVDEVTFPTCDVQSYKHYDRNGKLLDSARRNLTPGRGTAVRVKGTWYLKQLDAAADLVGCATETAAP
jgi:hypothetical protein